MAQTKNRIVDDLTLWLYLPAVILLGIACAIPVYDWAMASDSELAHELTRKGPNRLTRRVIMLFAFFSSPLHYEPCAGKAGAIRAGNMRANDRVRFGISCKALALAWWSCWA